MPKDPAGAYMRLYMTGSLPADSAGARFALRGPGLEQARWR